MSEFPGLGPQYWMDTFGFASYDDFKGPALEAINGTLPSIPLFSESMVKLAWYNPVSVAGSFITAKFVALGFSENNPSGPATVVSNALLPLWQNNAQQEATVPALVIPNCFQVSIQMAAGAHPVENVVGVQNASGTAAGAAAAVKAAWEVASGPLTQMSNLVSMVNYHAVDISSLTGTIADLSSTAVGGLSTNTLSTRAACALVKWNGSNRSRSTRGRLYFGPIRESDIDADGATVSAAIRTNFNTAFTNFRNSLSAAGYPLVVLSRKNSTATIVTQHAIETLLATQRRRIR